MDVRICFLVTGFLCASFAQQLNAGVWTVDEVPTKNMHLEGMTFFHEKPRSESDEKKIKNQDTQDGGHNLLHAFSHFMPDQSKLSLAAGLSRAADMSKMDRKHDVNNIFDYAPKDKLVTPFTSEIVGNSEQQKAIPQWMSNTFTRNDVMNSGNSQMIELSQLGIVKENVAVGTNVVDDVKEISYLNDGTNVFASGNFFDNSPREGVNFQTSDTMGITNNFDNTEIVDNSFVSDVNKNSFIFNDELSPPDITTQVESGNSIFKLNLQNKNIEPIVRDFPTQFPLTSPNPTGLPVFSNRNAFNQLDLSTNNSINLEISKKEIVKPFPFGQIQGDTKPPTSKRVPTLEIKRNFVDNSRKPILRVQSKFVDMSGRQNPKMETIGSFVDTSMSKQPITTAETISKQTTAIYPIIKTTLISTNKPYSTMSSPTIRTSPVFIDPPLQGVPSSNTNQVKTNDISKMWTNRSNGGNSEMVKPKEDNLKVDMLYPPAPFPVLDQSNTISNVDTPSSGDQNTNNAFKTNEQDKLLTTNDNKINPETIENIQSIATVTSDNDALEKTPVELDYDLYADGNPSSDDQTQLGSNGLSESRIPLDMNHNDDRDHFITDPNVQIINPSNQAVPRGKQINQNTFGTDTLRKEINDVANSGLLPSNENSLQGNMQQNNQNRQLNGQFANGNNQINKNQFMNPNIQGPSIESGIRTNGQFSSNLLPKNGNVMNQNTFNQNVQPRFQQDENNVPFNRFSSARNRISDQKQSVFSGVNAGQNNFMGSQVTTSNQQNNRLPNGLSSTGQTNINNVQNIANKGVLSDNQNNLGSTLSILGKTNNRPSTPNNVMNRNINSNTPINQRNNFVNSNALSSNGNLNQQNSLIKQNLIPKNAGPQQNNKEIAVNTRNTFMNPNFNQNIARNTQNNAANSNFNQNVIGNTQNNAANLNFNKNTLGNTQGNAINQLINSRVTTQPRGQNMGTRPINSNLPLSQGQGFINQGIAQTGNIGISVPNVNVGNQVRNQAGLNGMNSQIVRRNFNSINGNFAQNDINLADNNLQNRPLLSSNNNRQIPPNSFQNTQNNFPRNTNALASNVRSGQSFAQTFQNQNNFMARPNSILNPGNGLQRFGQNNGNLLQNRQNIGNFPNSVTNMQRTFQGNLPQFQNSLPSNMQNRMNIQNVDSNFGQNPSANGVNNMGVNTFPNNVQFNQNPIRTNMINRQFGAFR